MLTCCQEIFRSLHSYPVLHRDNASKDQRNSKMNFSHSSRLSGIWDLSIVTDLIGVKSCSLGLKYSIQMPKDSSVTTLVCCGYSAAVGGNKGGKRKLVTSFKLPCHMCSAIQNQSEEMNKHALLSQLKELNMRHFSLKTHFIIKTKKRINQVSQSIIKLSLLKF